MFKNSLLSLRYRFLDSWFVAASHFERWLHLGAGPPRLAISPPYSGTSRMVDKPVMVSFLLSSKTSSVRDLNTSGESRLHSLAKLWMNLLTKNQGKYKATWAQQVLHRNKWRYVTVPKLMLFCWKRCLQYLQLLVLHEESIRMYAAWSHDSQHISIIQLLFGAGSDFFS